MFDGYVFQQAVSIRVPIVILFSPTLMLLKIDVVLSRNNSKFGDCDSDNYLMPCEQFL